MSAFEKLPREVRDMIYGYCLIYDGDIIPYPSIDEREEIEESGEKAAKRCLVRYDYDSIMEVRSCGGIRYAADWPSIALLGVSKGIQEEAANILFGENVWRLSYVYQWGEGNGALWKSYARHFRHITTYMSMNDAGNMIKVIKKTRAKGKELGWSTNDVKHYIHTIGSERLTQCFEWTHQILIRMNLKSLVFNVKNLFCPHGCCRKRLLRSLCEEMGQEGPWYRLKVSVYVKLKFPITDLICLDVEARCKIDVKVVGLENELEKEIFMDHWGLEV